MSSPSPPQPSLLNTDKDGNLIIDGKVVFVNAPDEDIAITVSVLEQILTTLKKIEYHLSIASDTELNDQDV